MSKLSFRNDFYILKEMFRMIIELKIIGDTFFYDYIVKPLFPNKSSKNLKRILTIFKNVYINYIHINII